MKYVLAVIYNFLPVFHGVFLNHTCLHKKDTYPMRGRKFLAPFADPPNFQFTKDLAANSNSRTYYAAIAHWSISRPGQNMTSILLIPHMHRITSSAKIWNWMVIQEFSIHQ
jgi:hypothetical protein